jgi:outer membrane protein assembly factor BamB
MKNRFSTILVIFFSLIGIHAKSQSIAQFRGPDRNGIYPETGLLDSWPAEGPKLL